MFDVISLLDRNPHDVLYEVLDKSKVLKIPIEKVRFLLNNNITFNEIFYSYIAAQMRHLKHIIVQNSLYSVKNRLMDLLIQNINSKNRFENNQLDDLSNSEVAHLVGTVRHVIEKLLKELGEENIIEKERKKIKINSLEKLLEITSKMQLK